jgi:hypothetical protein
MLLLFTHFSHSVIVEVEVNVPWPPRVVPYEVLITWRSLIFGVACKHTLQAYAYTLHIVYRTPCLSVEQIETYYAVRVDVRVHRYGMGGVFHEDNFGCFWRVVSTMWLVRVDKRGLLSAPMG